MTYLHPMLAKVFPTFFFLILGLRQAVPHHWPRLEPQGRRRRVRRPGRRSPSPAIGPPASAAPAARRPRLFGGGEAWGQG